MQGALPHYAITHAFQGAEPASCVSVRYLCFLRPAMAIQQGLFAPPAPEWWPANG